MLYRHTLYYIRARQICQTIYGVSFLSKSCSSAKHIAVNVCQEKAGNHSYIFKIRRGLHFGYTKNKAQLSRLFPACSPPLLFNIVIFCCQVHIIRQVYSTESHLCHTCMWFYCMCTCIQVRVSSNMPNEELYFYEPNKQSHAKKVQIKH